MLAARRLRRLCLVEADISALYPEACSMLRNEAPFEALRLRRLCIYGDQSITDTAVLAAQLAAHPSLRELALLYVPLHTFAALDAVVDTALALRLTRLKLHSCRVGPASAVAFTQHVAADARLWLCRGRRVRRGAQGGHGRRCARLNAALMNGCSSHGATRTPADCVRVDRALQNTARARCAAKHACARSV